MNVWNKKILNGIVVASPLLLTTISANIENTNLNNSTELQEIDDDIFKISDDRLEKGINILFKVDRQAILSRLKSNNNEDIKKQILADFKKIIDTTRITLLETLLVVDVKVFNRNELENLIKEIKKLKYISIVILGDVVKHKFTLSNFKQEGYIPSDIDIITGENTNPPGGEPPRPNQIKSFNQLLEKVIFDDRGLRRKYLKYKRTVDSNINEFGYTYLILPDHLKPTFNNFWDNYSLEWLRNNPKFANYYGTTNFHKQKELFGEMLDLLGVKEKFDNDIDLLDLKLNTKVKYDSNFNVAIMEALEKEGFKKWLNKEDYYNLLDVYNVNDEKINIDNLTYHALMVSGFLGSSFGVDKTAKMYLEYINNPNEKINYFEYFKKMDNLIKTKNVKLFNHSYSIGWLTNTAIKFFEAVFNETINSLGIIHIFANGNLLEEKEFLNEDYYSRSTHFTDGSIFVGNLTKLENKYKPHPHGIYWSFIEQTTSKPLVTFPSKFSIGKYLYEDNTEDEAIIDGTSFSTPFISGLISLWLKNKKIQGTIKNWEFNMPAVKSVLMSSLSVKQIDLRRTSHCNENGLYRYVGAGIPNYNKMLLAAENLKFYTGQELYKKDIISSSFLLKPGKTIKLALSSTVNKPISANEKNIDEMSKFNREYANQLFKNKKRKGSYSLLLQWFHNGKWYNLRKSTDKFSLDKLITYHNGSIETLKLRYVIKSNFDDSTLINNFNDKICISYLETNE
ncbi:S8 family serine peptidase [Mycoplasmopsis iners]|uniref:S8 family serine peptidase n=1 Tax=Mycoplasmopsis iners TaxID=76630 RepID=UPI0004972A11|nr:S8 family serine peptidase [Mycoplasmopsis iners]